MKTSILSILSKFDQILEKILPEIKHEFRQELQKMLPAENAKVTWKMSAAAFREEHDFLNSTFLQVSKVQNAPENLNIAQILEKILIQTEEQEYALLEKELDRVLTESQAPYELRFSPCVLIDETTHFLHFNLIGTLKETTNYVV